MTAKGKIEGYHRAKAILPEIKELITQGALSTDAKREALADELLVIIKSRYPRQVPPSRDTIIKMISKARQATQSVLDKPWHLGLIGKLTAGGIPSFNAEAVEAILKVQQWLSSNYLETSGARSKGKKITGLHSFASHYRIISIRQAKWIAILYRWTGKETEYLWLASFHYTYHEIISEIARTPLDTLLMDKNLYSGKKIFIDYVKHAHRFGNSRLGEEHQKAHSIIATATMIEETNDSENYKRVVA